MGVCFVTSHFLANIEFSATMHFRRLLQNGREQQELSAFPAPTSQARLLGLIDRKLSLNMVTADDRGVVTVV